jgi:hypothetical protein
MLKYTNNSNVTLTQCNVHKQNDTSRYKESVYGYLCDLHVCKWNDSDEYICWKCVLSNCGISCVSCVIDSVGLPCAFGLVIFWYTIADSKYTNNSNVTLTQCNVHKQNDTTKMAHI